tara:strand:- start:15105 stop:15323 length:219 start_codon:yes stop_codon:yes gene_type:complete
VSRYARLDSDISQQVDDKLVKMKEESVSLNVRDTDFLLKTLIECEFKGREVEQAYTTMKKLSDLHRKQTNES